ncbi:MAG: hypothetical protein ACKO3W_16130 [bacterium]
MNLASRAILASSLVALLATAGCNIVTPVAYAIEGPGQIDAEFELPKKKTVVFVDDPRNILPRTALRTALGDAISFDLMDREILESTVASRDAVAVARAGSSGNANQLKSVEVIGKALDCAQVIHIQPTVFDLTGRTDDRGIRPTAIVRVKVMDLELRARSYPSADAMPEGREVTAIIREKGADSLRTRAGRTQVEDELVRKLAVEVAQLFYQHDRVDLGENLGTRRQ